MAYCVLRICLLAFTVVGATDSQSETVKPEHNPVFVELVEKGVLMPDGTRYKLPQPAMADGLDAEGQKAAIAKIAAGRYSLKSLMRKRSSAPVIIRIRTLKAPEG
ncbi:MAG: hypothetical protein ACWGMZ_00285, partial [Thermoguttaceae bacterium]